MRTRRRAGKSLLIMLVGCGLVSVAAGVGIGMLVARRAPASADGPSGGKSKDGHAAPKVATIHSLGEMVVNLADTRTMRYAKLAVALGITEKVPDEKLKEVEPPLRDAVIDVITNKQFKELHQPGGTRKLKEEIRRATGRRVPDVTVVEVYLDSFAMQ
jgi:flagellar basal body-associated protein FliL